MHTTLIKHINFVQNRINLIVKSRNQCEIENCFSLKRNFELKILNLGTYRFRYIRYLILGKLGSTRLGFLNLFMMIILDFLLIYY